MQVPLPIGRPAYLSKPEESRRAAGNAVRARIGDAYHPGSPVSPEAHAVFLNAVPLFVLAAIYLAAAGSLLPSLWRERGAARELEYALALVFPCGGVAAGLFGVLVLLDREPVGGRPWIAFAAIASAGSPGLGFFARLRDRGLLLTGSKRSRGADECDWA